MKVTNVMNVVKMVSMATLVLMVVGCAGIQGSAKKEFSGNKTEGIIYGFKSNFKTASIQEVCSTISNADSRCSEQENYQVVRVMSEVGFASGFMGSVALAPKEMKLGDVCTERNTSKCIFLKVKVEKNKLGTVLDVASRPGENKCHWNGMPGAGGTVCEVYNWDYRKNNQAAIVQ